MHANITNSEKLWKRLQESELVKGAPPICEADDNPWYLKAMQGFAGWIAAFFLLGFLATFFSWIFSRDNAFLLLTMGLTGNGIAYILFRSENRNEFVHQLGLVFNLCGQLLVAWGLYEALHSIDANYFFTLFVYQSLLVFLLADYSSRLATTWFALIALFACFAKIGLFNLSTALVSLLFVLVWSIDHRWLKQKSLWEPIGYGLSLSLLQFNGQLLFGEGDRWWFRTGNVHWFNDYSFWLSEFILAGLFIFIIYALVKRYAISIKSKQGAIVIAAGLLLLALGYFVNGTSAAILLLLIGFIKQRKILFSLGIIALLGFISWYYYHLGLTLYTKSIILLSFGTVFFLLFYWINLYSRGEQLSLSYLKEKYSLNNTKWIASIGLLFILVLINHNIYNKEQVIKHGEVVLLELAPVDPRSLMQGDYMRLNFAIERTILKKEEEALSEVKETRSIQKRFSKADNEGYFVVELDKNKVATFSKIYQGETLDTNQVKMQFRIRNYRLQLATHAFFFQEGTGSVYSKARYGEFRVAENGELLLNNIRDQRFKILGFNRPSN